MSFTMSRPSARSSWPACTWVHLWVTQPGPPGAHDGLQAVAHLELANTLETWLRARGRRKLAPGRRLQVHQLAAATVVGLLAIAADIIGNHRQHDSLTSPPSAGARRTERRPSAVRHRQSRWHNVAH